MGEKEKKPEQKNNAVSIIPLRDFEFRHNKFYYDMKKGKKIDVDKMFLENLKTEKVIKS